MRKHLHIDAGYDYDFDNNELRRFVWTRLPTGETEADDLDTLRLFLESEPPARERLMALQFGPLSSVRIGAYMVNAKIVDAETVQSGQYVVFEGSDKAQFGAMIGSSTAATLCTT